MTEVLLSDVEEFPGSNDKGPWLKYTLKDGNGQAVAVTFDAKLGNVAKAHIGERVAIETKPSSNPKYAPTLVSVEAAANGGSAAPIETHHKPVIGGDKDRAITRMACLKAAAIIIGPYGAKANSEDLALEVMKAAQRFETWVYRDIDDIPFGD